MNLSEYKTSFCSRLRRFIYWVRPLVWKQRCRISFGPNHGCEIQHVYVINLTRQPERWRKMLRELRHIQIDEARVLAEITTRVPAVDARNPEFAVDSADIVPFYTLGDQLFVDPRVVLPPKLDLDERIEMSRPEIAVARSHVDVWRRIADGPHRYALILEDDVRFTGNFARHVDRVWADLTKQQERSPAFDVLYLSYREVECGSEKNPISKCVSRLYRGVWYLSGYVVSREGARKLLEQLPVGGPIDLWINHQFSKLEVYCSSKSLIEQRSEEVSQNSYSILPVLSKTGLLNSEGPGHFDQRPLPHPVFAIGPPDSGLSSLAMALSMVGYRCLSDLDALPPALLDCLHEFQSLPEFTAYVNIGPLESRLDNLAKIHPDALLIDTSPDGEAVNEHSRLWQGRLLRLPLDIPDKWKRICEFIRVVPPACPYPEVHEFGRRRLFYPHLPDFSNEQTWCECDSSPWVAVGRNPVSGIPSRGESSASERKVVSGSATSEDSYSFSENFWIPRKDTFQGNLALFDPSNITEKSACGVELTVRQEDMVVRQFSAGALTSQSEYLFGRFSAVLKPPKVSGLVTGVFLHRDSPRQEIDIEFLGNSSDKILTNVFYNPGMEGDRFDYGYRGTPCLVDLGFDYTKDFHEYSIEWGPDEIRWLVDGRAVHTRINWAPTPIPHLPMRFHVNLWPSISRELAGDIAEELLPASVTVRSASLPRND